MQLNCFTVKGCAQRKLEKKFSEEMVSEVIKNMIKTSETARVLTQLK